MSRDALIVGINNYQALRKLKAPADDAEAIAKILEQYGEFDIIQRLPMGITADNKDCVGKNELVTVPKLEKALVGLFKPSGKSIPDLALFFFAGHGLRIERGIEEGYLATSEASPDSGNRGLSFQWLRRLLEGSPVKTQIIFLDCCYSGEVFHFDEADPADRGRARDRLFVAACREYQVAYEEISGQHGVLTRALLNALDPTKHSSGIVHNDTLVNLIRDSWQVGLQSPLIHNSGERFVLTRSAKPAQIITPVSETVCPYRGLRYFDCNEEDPKFFFGRTALTDQLLDKVRESNFMAVLGASGSGKSSVIRAGLIHQLRLGQRLSGSDTWKILMFRPGDDPLENLALAFLDPNHSDIQRGEDLKTARKLVCEGDLECLISAMASDNRRVVLLADQFEEVFTLCKDMAKRRQFFECLLGALPKCGRKICLILAMRADFFGKCAEQHYAGLYEFVQKNLITVTPMNDEELRDAIVKPAKLAGAQVEPELVNEIAKDVKDSPGTLPLMQYALTELWKVRDADTLKLTQYSRMGGVKGTLAKRADEIYNAFSDEERDIARRIFIELTQLGEGTEDTRRQVRKDALISLPEKEAMVNEVIRKLADEKLIVTSEIRAKDEARQTAVVDVAHEALIRNWTQLRTWLDKSRDDIRFHRRLSAAAEYWERHGKAEGLLWRAPDLEFLEKFYQTNIREMKTLEIEFFEASVQSKEQAIAAQKGIADRERELVKSGIAMDFIHKISNSAGTIPAWLSLIKRRLKSASNVDPKIIEYCDKINRDIGFLIDEAHKLKNPTSVPEKTDMTDVVGSIVAQIEMIVAPDIKIEFNDPDYDLFPIYGIKEQISTAIYSVMQNSVKAISGHGKITVDIKNIKNKERKYIEIDISDTGCGISQDKIDSIFEYGKSFWTDKKGTGYELWRAKSIIQSMNGNIQVTKTKEGEGTTFTITLPVE